MGKTKEGREMMEAEKRLVLAWNNYQQSDADRTKSHYLGLKLGQACAALRSKSKRQGGPKGSGFEAIYKAAGVPRNTAYRWIKKYEDSGDPDNWLTREKSRLDRALGASRARALKSSRIFQRKLRAKAKRAEADIAAAQKEVETARKKLAEAEAAKSVVERTLASRTPAEARPIGRPRNEELARRVRELKAAGKSWGQVKMILDHETSEQRALSTYRGYAENS